MKSLQNPWDDFLVKLRFKPAITFTPQDVNRSFALIQERIQYEASTSPASVSKRIAFYQSPFFHIASSFVLVAMLSFMGYKYMDSHQQVEIANTTELVKDYILPDGSKIWLRMNSSLRYHSNFSDNRNVSLDGEAVFEVMKNPNAPFTVETMQGKVTVLGTVFSVRAFPEESYTKTILKKGSVSLTNNNDYEVKLVPGQEGLMMKDAQEIKVRKVANVERQFAWQTRKFSFENESLDVIAAVVSESFNKKLVISNQVLASKRLTVKFNRNESLTRIMEVLSEVGGFRYQEINDSIVIR